MPFTVSHAVVALPFIRTPLVPAAIAIGAMTPDLPLFVRGTPLTYQVTHSNAWIVVTMLVALVLFVAWRGILRPAVRELSPRALAARLPDEWDTPFPAAVRDAFGALPGRPRGRAYPLLLAASLLIGVASHILWDSFTHEGRDGLGVFPALEEQWGPLLGYKWLQYGSTVAGLVILAVWALLWLRRRDAAATVARVLPARVRVAWMLSLPAILAFAWAAGLMAFGPLTAEFTVAHLAYLVLPPACAVWGLLTIGLCVAVQVLRRRRA